MSRRKLGWYGSYQGLLNTITAVICCLAGFFAFLACGVLFIAFISMAKWTMPFKPPSQSLDGILAVMNCAIGLTYFISAYALLQKREWSFLLMLVSAASMVSLIVYMLFVGFMLNLPLLVLNLILLAWALTLLFYLRRDKDGQ